MIGVVGGKRFQLAWESEEGERYIMELDPAQVKEFNVETTSATFDVPMFGTAVVSEQEQCFEVDMKLLVDKVQLEELKKGQKSTLSWDEMCK